MEGGHQLVQLLLGMEEKLKRRVSKFGTGIVEHLHSGEIFI